MMKTTDQMMVGKIIRTKVNGQFSTSSINRGAVCIVDWANNVFIMQTKFSIIHNLSVIYFIYSQWNLVYKHSTTHMVSRINTNLFGLYKYLKSAKKESRLTRPNDDVEWEHHRSIHRKLEKHNEVGRSGY